MDRYVYLQAGAFVATCAAAGAVIGAIVAWLKGA